MAEFDFLDEPFTNFSSELKKHTQGLSAESKALLLQISLSMPHNRNYWIFADFTKKFKLQGTKYACHFKPLLAAGIFKRIKDVIVANPSLIWAGTERVQQRQIEKYNNNRL